MSRKSSKLFLFWDEATLTIAPAMKGLEKVLSYTEKKMEKDPSNPWSDARIKKTKVELFTRIEKNGVQALQTMQGFLNLVLDWCKEKGIEFQVFDQRQPFPEPRMDLTCGFRFKQKELLASVLSKRRSGCLGAPTRYGKSTLLRNTILAFPGLTTVVTVPGKDVVKQLYEELKERLPHREVKLIGAGSRTIYQSEDITVCSMDSLHKLDPAPVRLLLIDEPHAAISEERFPEISKFYLARKYAFGATLDGRFDNRDILLTGVVGPVLGERTYLEAVEEGAICPLVVFWIDVPFAPFLNSFRRHAFDHVIYRNKVMAKLSAQICNEVIPPEWQTLIFISNEKQAEFYMETLEASQSSNSHIAMAKLLSSKERIALTDRIKADEIKRCFASKIYSQGVTFHHVRAMINAEGGGGNTSSIQKPGRLAEVRPGKKVGVVFDFNLRCTDPTFAERNPRDTAYRMAEIDCMNRRKSYEKKGYAIIPVKSVEELKRYFNAVCV